MSIFIWTVVAMVLGMIVEAALATTGKGVGVVISRLRGGK